MESRKDQEIHNQVIKNETIRGIAKVTPIKSVLTQQMIVMVWACEAKGGNPHNKNHIKYEGDGNKTQRTSKYEMV